MRQLLPGDIIWRNIRLATMDPQRQTPYGLVDNHALIGARRGHRGYRPAGATSRQWRQYP
ncbi:imidazolonepropionase [Salmonella bongori]|nr:imidazolonepropionase [Salmonella bongori]